MTERRNPDEHADEAMKHDERTARDRRESGEPGGGQGRRDEVGPTGVYPLSAENIPPGAEIRMAGSWGGGDYNESGGSELIYRDGILLGGLTAGPAGEPTIDIHAGRSEPPVDASAASDRPTEGGSEGDSPAAVDRNELLLRGLPPGGESGMMPPEGAAEGGAARP